MGLLVPYNLDLLVWSIVTGLELILGWILLIEPQETKLTTLLAGNDAGVAACIHRKFHTESLQFTSKACNFRLDLRVASAECSL